MEAKFIHQARKLSEVLHPGWLGPPRSTTEIMALKMGLTSQQLVEQMTIAVMEIVEQTLVYKNRRSTDEYLAHQRELDSRRLKAFAELHIQEEVEVVEKFLDGKTSHWFFSDREIWVGSFEDYLDWYVTDDWGLDSWETLPLEILEPDTRLQIWLDNPDNISLDLGNETEQ